MNKLKVLIACEESQTVCKAFRERGFQAYSCDIEPCSGGHPEWHIEELHFQCIIDDILDDHKCTTKDDFIEMQDLLTQLVELAIDDYMEEITHETQTSKEKR